MSRWCSTRQASWLLGTLVLVVGCEQPLERDASTPEDVGPPWFEQVAVSRGIDFVWKSGHRRRHYMPEIMGGGVALFDMDGDGDLDAYFVQGGDLRSGLGAGGSNRLLENDGEGRFRDITERSNAGDTGYGMGVACGDVDNDGDVDLYVTNLGPNRLFRNDGGGVFTDVSAAAGVANGDWGTSAAFFDMDRDGDLDLFVLNYVSWSIDHEIVCYNASGAEDYCLPANYGAPGQAILYENRGDGRFTDATLRAGISGTVGTGLGVVVADFDGDAWPDVFVANDGLPDHLWLNRRDGSFVESATPLGVALDQEGRAKAGMGVDAADVDHDLDEDLLVCNLRQESDSLFLNESGYFRDGTIAARLGIASRVFTRFGVGLRDFDHDGYLDLYEANGRVMRADDRFGDDPYAEPNLLLRGDAGPRFERVAPAGGTAETLWHTSRAAAFGDVDGDGGIDVVVVNRDGPAYLLRNVVPGRGHWLTLQAVDEHGRDALGAIIELTVGDRRLVRTVRAASSYLASSDPRTHFGLGEATTVKDLTVRWPDGTRERFGEVGVDQVTRIEKGKGLSD